MAEDNDPRSATAATEEDQDQRFLGGDDCTPKKSVMIVENDPSLRTVKVKIWDGSGYKLYKTDGEQSEEVVICRNSLFCIPITGCFRRTILSVVENQWFDSFILLCIVINSILMVFDQRRAGRYDEGTEGWVDDNVPNRVIAFTGEFVLTAIFTMECVMKILAWGFVLDKRTYLRDSWNILDFIVVCSSLIEAANLPVGNLSFLRLFRVLRPLRSLNRLPELKVLVNTAISAVPRLGSVAALGLFIFLVFAIVGVTLMTGIFYRRCRQTEFPELVTNGTLPDGTIGTCWHWAFATGDAASRLCGGMYNCKQTIRGREEVLGYCFGHEAEVGSLKPKFPNGMLGPWDTNNSPPWCRNSEPAKWTIDPDTHEVHGWPETDFVHFDHIGGAFLLVFQSMTMEGWTDLMYYAVDGMNVAFAWFYFFLLIIITSHFLLNVALAVVDEAREDFENEEEEEEAAAEREAAKSGVEKDTQEMAAEIVDTDEEEEEEDEIWWDVPVVRVAKAITKNVFFSNFIMLIIAGNVVTMMLEQHPEDVGLLKVKTIIGQIFLVIFIIEMILELLARGIMGYIKFPTTCFDGLVVIVSIIEEVSFMMGGNPGGLKALRTLRLFRVLNKFASQSPPLKILLKAMIATGKFLRYWLILFFLVLYISTLMWMHFFANRFQFVEADAPASTFAQTTVVVGSDSEPWCPDKRSLGNSYNHLRSDCIPRAHFDNFGWGFVTVFQIMTGENWNTIMYAALRSGGCSDAKGNGGDAGPIECMFYGLLHVSLLLFGQILFLSLFLSMLLSKFDEFKDNMTEAHQEQMAEKARTAARISTRSKSSSSLLAGNGGPGTLGDQTEGSDMVTEHTKENGMQSTGSALSADEPEALPGQLIELPQVDGDNNMSVGKKKRSHEDVLNDQEGEGLKDQPGEIPSTQKWPHGYSYFIMTESNPLRAAANWCLNKKVTIRGSEMLVFDNFILICILLSTLFMCLDSPLADENAPGWGWLKFVRATNIIFAIIFIGEMALKLCAYPAVWGENAYFTGTGCAWNWLDATVVVVSIITMPPNKGPSFLKTLRILRAFRPLRVINRMETLKMVVETIFKSMMELGMLLVVFLLFLLIFALLALMYLKGTFQACDESGGDAVYMRDLEGFHGVSDMQNTYTLPLCFNETFVDINYAGATTPATWDADSRSFSWGTCSAGLLSWRRVSEDTPICVARCSMHEQKVAGPDLCPQRYTTTEQLPSRCEEVSADYKVNTYAVEEEIGDRYVAAMTTSYTLPCAGAPNLYSPVGVESISCREMFCGSDVSAEKKEECKNECEIDPLLCDATCVDASDTSEKCVQCRTECQAACECRDFCEPLIKDAALCHEQGSQWGEILAQNFNNVWNSMLTLLEISTTEGWVDVMYAACDIDMMGGPHIQPKRDSEYHFIWAFFFVLWIMFSFMFLMNLGVGIIVDKFMDMQNQGQEAFLLPGQAKWVKTRMCLHGQGMIFSLYNIHELPPIRRKFYDFVSHPYFERTIMTCIVVNTLMMTIVAFPELEKEQWWNQDKVGWKSLFGYFFALVFTVECVLKLVALRWFYWKDSWNIFDFCCVTATLIGILLDVANTGIELGEIPSVIRIFRIARLFRLLRFKPLRPLNKLFMSLAISLVKLANVGIVMVLFLILFSILGVSLFGTVKGGETLNEHGNFRHFPNAFVTLFRASTGEAWNNIMHDLAMREEDWFRKGEWCTPAELFDYQDKFEVLQAKCLIDMPNSCVQTFGNWNPLPWFYFISYTLFIGMVIMNVVIAVILQGYDETRTSDESDIIGTCKSLWGEKYDLEHRMKIKAQGKRGAIHFMFAALQELQHDGLVPGQVEIPLGGQLTCIPMKYARALDVKIGPEDEVSFHMATTQVLRLIAVLDAEHSPTPTDFDAVIEQLDKCDSAEVMAKSKEIRKVKALEKRNTSFSSDDRPGFELSKTIAASKMQIMFKLARKARKVKECTAVQDLTGADNGSPDGNRDDLSEDLRAAAASEAVAEPTGLTPPIAG